MRHTLRKEKKGQDAIEYLLLIGAAILLALIVLLILFQGTDFLRDVIPFNIGIYQGSLSQATGLGGNSPSGSIGFSLSATPLPMAITLSYAPVSFQIPSVNHFLLAKSKNLQQINALAVSGPVSFQSPPAGVEIFSSLSNVVPGTFTDDAVSEGADYVYKLLACYDLLCTTYGVSNVSVGHMDPYTLSFQIDESGTQLVFNYMDETTSLLVDSCTYTNAQGFTVSDIPDAQARAIRMTNGELLLTGSHFWENRLSYGTGFNDLDRACLSGPGGFVSNYDPDSGDYDYAYWIASVYRNPATPDEIIALAHNEYHDPNLANSPPCTPGTTGDPNHSNLCWYNSIVGLVSTDDGRTFQFQGTNGSNSVVAPLPFVWDHLSGVLGPTGYRPPGPIGYFSPSNILSKQEGGTTYYYSFVYGLFDPQDPQVSGTCLMRTATLSDPASWRFWNGVDFSLKPQNSYSVSTNNTFSQIQSTIGQVPSPYFCSFVDPNINPISGSVVFNTVIQKYMMVGIMNTGAYPDCGTSYALSNDLIHWTRPRQLRIHELSWSPCN